MACGADYLCFLHADSLPGVSAARLRSYLDRAPQWGFCRVRLSGRRPVFRVIEWFMNLRSRLTAVATGDQMLFLHRSVFECSGGFDNIPLMEDVALARSLKGQMRVLPVAAQTSAARYDKVGWLGQGARNLWRLARYFLGVSPERLARGYASRN